MASQSLQRSSTSAPQTQAASPSRAPTAQSRFGNAFLAEQLAQKGGGPAPAPDSATQSTEVAAPGTAAGDVATGSGVATGTGTSTTTGADTGQSAVDTTLATAKIGKLPNPKPVQEGEQRRKVAGVTIIGRDVSPTAVDACERFVTATIGSRPDIQKRMEEANVALVILPRNKTMIEVAEFAGLKDETTFDGRPWAEVRGSGGRPAPGGLWAIAVPEENLIETGGTEDKYAPGYSVGLHEFAHTLQSKGVSEAERAEILELYAAREKAGGPWTEAYGASNDQEYFAQVTNCYFGQNAVIGHNGPEWLRDNDRPMYDFLVKLYGAAQAAPAAGPAPTGAPAADTSGHA